MRGRSSSALVRRCAVVTATLVALLAAVPQSAQAAIRTKERTFAAMVNDERAGVLSLLPPLELRERLCDVARRHSRRMADRGKLFHSKLDRLLGDGITRVGENVAYAGSLSDALEGFLGSPPHLANIMGPYTMTGVGVVRRDGTLWITQIFAA
jgi:uncharacterized protein YkwD